MVKSCKHGLSPLLRLSKFFLCYTSFSRHCSGEIHTSVDCIMNNSLHHGRFLQLVQDVHCREHGNGLPETSYIPVYVRLAVSFLFLQNHFGLFKVKSFHFTVDHLLFA